jgi:hypothetical protein
MSQRHENRDEDAGQQNGGSDAKHSGDLIRLDAADNN